MIEVTEFVPAEEIDPDYFVRAYYLGAGKDGEPAYRLLHDALERTGRVAIGRWTFHNRDYLVAIRPLDGPLVLHTMRFADELVPPSKVKVPQAAAQAEQAGDRHGGDAGRPPPRRLRARASTRTSTATA